MHKQITHLNWWMNEHFTSSQECHIFTNQSQTAEAQSQGVNWPHFLMWRSNNTFWPPLLTCIKHDYCRVWVTIMHHQRHSLRPLRTQNWHVCLTIPVSSTTAERSVVILIVLTKWTLTICVRRSWAVGLKTAKRVFLANRRIIAGVQNCMFIIVVLLLQIYMVNIIKALHYSTSKNHLWPKVWVKIVVCL